MWIIGRAPPFHAAYAVEPPVTKRQLHSSSTSKNPDYSLSVISSNRKSGPVGGGTGAEISPISIFPPSPTFQILLA